jgi:hypothetical protein
MKFCRKCGTFKSLDEFSADRHQFDGKQCYCKSCISKLYQMRLVIRKQGRIPTLSKYTDEELLNELQYRLKTKKTIPTLKSSLLD